MRSAMTLLVILLLSMEHAGYAQSFTGPLRGVIRMPGQAGVTAIVRVRLERAGITVRDVFLRENRFEFDGLPHGRYTLTVDAEGFQYVRQDLYVPGDFANIELRPLRNAVGRTEVVRVANLKIPKAAQLQFKEGKRMVSENKCPDAIVHLGKALQSYPEYGDAHRSLGECYMRMNQLEDAEREVKLALEQPHEPNVHLLLGEIYKRTDKKSLRERQIELFTSER